MGNAKTNRGQNMNAATETNQKQDIDHLLSVIDALQKDQESRLLLVKKNAALKAENAELKKEIAEIDRNYGTEEGQKELFVRELMRIL
jgi:cell division protein FtsB